MGLSMGTLARVHEYFRADPATTSFSTSILPKIAVGKEDWNMYFGDIGDEPPVPKYIKDILKDPCPFWGNRTFCGGRKRIEDTHMLTLIPSTVDGKPLNLKNLGELIKNPKGGGHATKYRFYSDNAKKALELYSVPRSYWVLMTKDLMPVGIKLNCYEKPTVLEATVSILMHYVKNKKRLFTEDPYTLTHCYDKDCREGPVYVGGFWPHSDGYGGGLCIDDMYYDDGFSFPVHCGIAGVRKSS